MQATPTAGPSTWPICTPASKAVPSFIATRVAPSPFSGRIPARRASQAPLIGNGKGISWEATCAFSAPGSINNTDPRLPPLGAYGGPTLTMALLPGSPAMDAANPAYCPPADQRGVPRPQGGGCDIGAVEAAHLSLQNRGDGNWSITQGAAPGFPCALQVSTNLVDWSNLQTVIADPSGQAGFVAPDLGLGAQFFRTLGAP